MEEEHNVTKYRYDTGKHDEKLSQGVKIHEDQRMWQDEIGVLVSHCFFYLFLAQWSMWRRGQCVRLCWYAYQFRKIKVTAAVDVVQETQSRTQHVFEMFQCGIEVHSTIIALLIALFAFFED